MSLNKVQLIGNLGQDAELKFAPGGDAVVSLSVATNEKWKDKNSGELKERVEWHRVVVWGKTAESLAEYLTKGRQVYVEGRIQTKKWQDKKTGDDRYSTEIRCDRILLLSSPKAGGAKASGEAAADEVPDDIPF